MKYRLLALDLDGTLFDPDGRISHANRRAIQKAEQAGMIVALCTGRGLNESQPALEQLGQTGPMVLANGAMVSDPTTGQTLHRAELEPHLALEIVAFLDRGPHAVLILMDPQPTGLDYLVTSPQSMTANTHWWFGRIGARIKTVDHPTVEDMHHALRVGIVGPSGQMPELADSVRQRFGDRVFVQHFSAVKQDEEDVHILEVFAEGVNKWAGVRWLGENHGIGADQIAAIGDEINDLHLIQHAGCGIAMANAVEPIRRAADYQTLSNDENGVAHAIGKLLGGVW